MIKTEEDFRNYMKGKTVHFSLLLGFHDTAKEIHDKECELFQRVDFNEMSEEQLRETLSLLKALMAKNTYIIMSTFLHYLDIPEKEVDMTINPDIDIDRKSGEITITKGTPDWFNVVNHLSISFDPHNQELKVPSEKEFTSIQMRGKEMSKQFMDSKTLKKVNKSELEKSIFNKLM